MENKTKDIKKENNCKNCVELEKKITALVTTIDTVEDEKLVVENQLRRALADYQNLSNSIDKRVQIKTLQFKKSLVEKLIPSLDSMMMAIKESNNITMNEQGTSWLQGIKATLDTIMTSLKEIGLEQYIPVIGDKLDPSLHEVIATIENDNHGIVVEVIQPGYKLDNIVIRHARVVVSK